QDVCPWNRNAPASPLAEFMPRRITQRGEKRNSNSEKPQFPEAPENADALYAPPLEWLANLTEEEFREMFSGSAIKRAKWRGLIRNSCIAIGNSNLPPASSANSRALSTLERLSKSPESTVAKHAQWAITRLKIKITSS
ncbi:MAG: hypothetical protein ACRD4K_11725, partial [Candidatus Acidiferrales bacterium]